MKHCTFCNNTRLIPSAFGGYWDCNQCEAEDRKPAPKVSICCCTGDCCSEPDAVLDMCECDADCERVPYYTCVNCAILCHCVSKTVVHQMARVV